MCLSILKANSKVIPRQSWRPLKVKYIYWEEEKKKHVIFSALIERRWGKAVSAPKTNKTKAGTEEFKPYFDKDKMAWDIPDVEDTVEINCNLINQQPAYDNLIGIKEVAIHQDENRTIVGKVKRQTLNHDSRMASTYNSIPYLNIIVYMSNFPMDKSRNILQM